jgi:hypothetical protein
MLPAAVAAVSTGRGDSRGGLVGWMLSITMPYPYALFVNASDIHGVVTISSCSGACIVPFPGKADVNF